MGLRRLALALFAASVWPVSAQAPSAPPAPRFDISAYRIEGSSLIGDAALQETLKPFTGAGRDFGDVQRAIEAIETAYAKAGWGAVQVLLPEQTLEGGTVLIRVIEARIGSIAVEGQKHFGEENVKAAVPGLQVGQAPRPLDMQESVRLANENPAKQTALVLRAGEKEGEVEAVLRVADQPPRRLSVSLDNTGSRQTGKYRFGIGFMHANLFGRDHVLNVQAVTSPSKHDRVRIVGLGYRIPFYAWGDSLDLSAGYSSTDSGVMQQLFAVSGAGRVYGARYTKNFPRWNGWEPKLVFGLDHRAYENKAELIGTGIRLLPDITVRPASLAFGLATRGERSETAFSLMAVHNLPGGENGGAADFAATRAGADSHYTLWRWSASHMANFAGDWQWRAALNGQWTRDALVPGEQFGLGGANSVRGFLEREILNDRGHQGTLELYTPDFGARLAAQLRLRALAFYDFGRVTRISPLPGEIDAEDISSYGLGLRAGIGDSFSLRFDYGIVQQPGGSQGRGEGRGHLGLLYQRLF
ncbi:MAG: ShlB/FhaC/HecB family hemolysin secretion/activation protein [Rhodocyclaceae bacterium]